VDGNAGLNPSGIQSSNWINLLSLTNGLLYQEFGGNELAWPTSGPSATWKADGGLELAQSVASFRLSMKQLIPFCLVASLALATGCQIGSAGSKPPQADTTTSGQQQDSVWRGVHLLLGSDSQAAALQEQLPKLAAVGVAALILETDYNFEFRSARIRPGSGGSQAWDPGSIGLGG